MKCFYHDDKDAVGICKACQKGICQECAADLHHGLACKGRHENEVETLHKILTNTARAHSAAPRGIMMGPLFYATMGIIFTGYGVAYRGGITNFMSVLGIAFIAFGAVVYLYQRKIYIRKAGRPR